MIGSKLPRAALVLGLAGLLPQILALAGTFDEADRYIGLAAGFFYAALIYSFLGGLWWGIATSHSGAPKWIYGAAVAPSLIAYASGIPWMNGSNWPGPSLAILGFAILLSPLIDLRLFGLNLMGRDLFRLRVILSVGLGLLTVALALR